MVQPLLTTLGCMHDYADRLRHAMTLARKDVGQLAADLGVTYQAIKKVLDGGSKALNAANNVRAARALAVDSEWLATGEGDPHGSSAWPFPYVARARWLRASAADRGYVQAAINRALDDCESTRSKPEGMAA